MFCKFFKRPLKLGSLKIARYYSAGNVRVRFAPSPTGFLHLGGLRTALYNFLFAKACNGKFILRIEDTDQSRVVEGAMEQLQKDLEWSGIEIDEGPGFKNELGPYIQSKRLDIYRLHLKTLLGNGSAYHCFCSDKRLDLLRKEALRTREIPKYDNRCRSLDPVEVQKRLEQGLPSCVRFKLTAGPESFNDLIYGNISHDVTIAEGDPVIVKSDGYPTYHFANVVDDHCMEISHVLRGVEWQISTTKHIMMYSIISHPEIGTETGSEALTTGKAGLSGKYLSSLKRRMEPETAVVRAFNWQPPLFGHLPLLLNWDGSKLSKRQGDIRITSYRESGIFPLALLNYIVNSGGGFRKDGESHLKTKCYTIEELTEQFDVTKINSHSGKLMPERLLEFNRLELRRRLASEDDENRLIEDVRWMAEKMFPDQKLEGSLQTSSEHIRNVLHWSVNRINKLSDLFERDLRFIWICPVKCKVDAELSNSLGLLINSLSKYDELCKDQLNPIFKQFCKDNEIRFSIFMKELRSTLSGLKEGPSVAEMMEILGKEATIRRLQSSLRKDNSDKYI